MKATIWKKLAILLLVPGLALVLTACPESGEVGGGGVGTVEEGFEEAGEGVEEAGEGLGEGLEGAGEGLEGEGAGLGDE